MIFEVLERSLRQPNRVIPLEALLGNCEGSRMPDVIAARLTPTIAQGLVEVCPTGAFSTKNMKAGPVYNCPILNASVAADARNVVRAP